MKTLAYCGLVPNKMGAFEWLVVHMGYAYAEGGNTLVTAFAGAPCPELEGHLQNAGIRWHVLEGWNGPQGQEYPWRFCVPALRLLRREEPDVVGIHFGNELPSLAVSLLSCCVGTWRTRWIWQQQQQIRDPSFLTRRVSRIRLLAWKFTRLVAVYEGGRRSFLRRGVPAEQCAVIYNGTTDTSSTRERGWLRRELGISEEVVLAVSVNSLIPRKRVGLQVEALAAIRSKAPALHLVVVGGGGDQPALEQRARALGIQDRVHFLGSRRDVRDILAECNLQVHSASAEACAYAILEAMAAGLPVVAMDAGAAREQVADGVSGWVVDRDDVVGLAERMAGLALDAGRRKEMGTQARRRWAERHRVEYVARQYHALYCEVAEAALADRGEG